MSEVARDPLCRRHRFPAEVIAHAVWLYFRFPLSLRMVEDMLAARGLFGIGELLVTMEEGLAFNGIRTRVGLRDVGRTMAELPRYWVALLRSAAIGCWMGITPGGPTAASFMSYGLARRWSRRGKRFGEGLPEGVISPETADHAAGTCAMLPMLALGLPSSATAAVMMGGLMIWGLNPGPMLFTQNVDFVWGLIASMYMSNVVAVIVVLATVPIFAAILRIPFAIVGPLIVTACFIGAYTVNDNVFDFWMVLVFGAVGYLFKKLDYPLAPLVLAMVLGHKAEDAFRQSLIMAHGSLKRECGTKVERETRFYITSSTETADKLADVVRRHWAVESMHWLMDCLFRDDECRVRTRHAPANFTTVKHIAHNLLRRHPTKLSMTTKRLTAAWDEQFLISLVACEN